MPIGKAIQFLPFRNPAESCTHGKEVSALRRGGNAFDIFYFPLDIHAHSAYTQYIQYILRKRTHRHTRVGLYRPQTGDDEKMNIHLSLQSEIPTYEQIKVQIKAQILNGQLTPDQPLTSMRQLARDLRVSVITTTRAYSDLEAEGLIYTVQGRGCFVKGDAEMVRRQYLQSIDEALGAAVEKGKAAGLSLAQLQDRLEEAFHEQCH